MTTLDLEPARRLVENLMDDAGRVTRPPSDADATLNPDMSVTWPDPTTVYEGMCMVREKGTQERVFDAAGQELVDVSHVLSIPLSAGVPQHGDVFEVTEAQRDPELLGRTFTVRGVASAKTFAVMRKVGLTLRERVDR